MRKTFLTPLILFGMTISAQAAEVTAPVSVEMKSLFTAGTETYLEHGVAAELDKQVNAACGGGAILKNLDVHYVVNQVDGTDVSQVKLTGTVRCLVSDLPTFEVKGSAHGICTDHFGDSGYDDAVANALAQANAKCPGKTAKLLGVWKSQTTPPSHFGCVTTVTGTFDCE